MAGITHRGRQQRVVAFAAVVVVMLVGWVLGILLARRGFFPDERSRARTAYDRGDWPRAAFLAKSLLNRAPDDQDARRLVARCAARTGHDAVARALYARVGGASMMEAEDFYLMGTLLERAGDTQTARECWAQGLLADPSHPELIERFARLSLQSAQPERASSLARKLQTRPGWEVRGGLMLGTIEAGLNEPARAADALRQALERDPNARDAPHSPAWYRKLLARSLLQTGRHGEATAELTTILAKEPDPEAFWLLSRSLLQAGTFAAASTAWTRSGPYRDEVATAHDPAPYVGAARCVGCHPSIYKAEQDSLHARTFQRGRDFERSRLPPGPITDPAQPKVRHTLVRARSELDYQTRDDSAIVRGIVDYVFGSGKHGFTLVGHDQEGRAREFRLSHYSDGNVWDVTTGHPRQPSPGEGYLGRTLTPDDVRNCLLCHTTVTRTIRDDAAPESADRGIGCEACHGPGGNHLKAVAAHFPDVAIARPRLGTAAQVVALCARCHSPPGKVVAPDEPFAVRFPAAGLTWSRCYIKSQGKLDCRTCHDPHRDAEKDPAFYESKCVGCHTTRPGTSVCPVNPARDCLSCHMPRVQTTIPHSRFTDHHIRVRTEGRDRESTGHAQ